MSPKAKESGPIVDVNALRTNQALIVLFVVFAFVLGSTAGVWVILAVSASLAIGAAFPGKGPFQSFYRHVLLPTGIVRPQRRPDDPAQHRFAQGMGAAVLLLAAIALFAGVDVLGWTLAFIVVTLALVNLLFGFCAGCFVFLQINRFRERTGRFGGMIERLLLALIVVFAIAAIGFVIQEVVARWRRRRLGSLTLVAARLPRLITFSTTGCRECRPNAESSTRSSPSGAVGWTSRMSTRPMNQTSRAASASSSCRRRLSPRQMAESSASTVGWPMPTVSCDN